MLAPKDKLIVNFPNAISIARIIISPVILFFLISGDKYLILSACVLYFIASFTDTIDGWYARKYSKETSLGRFVDPLADKALTACAFIALVIMGIVELWMVAIIIFRDIGTTVMRIYADSVQKPMKTSMTAKWKTTFQMIFTSVVVVLIFLKEAKSFTSNTIGINPTFISDILKSNYVYFSMLFITLFTVWTIVEYIINNKNLFRKAEKPPQTR